MSMLTEGSRESLSSLFDLIFCSWALIWSQQAQAKSPGLQLQFGFFIEKCPGHFLANSLHIVIATAAGPRPWACLLLGFVNLLKASEPTLIQFHKILLNTLLKYIENTQAILSSFRSKTDPLPKLNEALSQKFWAFQSFNQFI